MNCMYDLCILHIFLPISVFYKSAELCSADVMVSSSISVSIWYDNLSCGIPTTNIKTIRTPKNYEDLQISLHPNVLGLFIT